MCEDARSGRVILFGGSDEGLDRRSVREPGQREPLHADMDNAVFFLDVSDGREFRAFLQAGDDNTPALSAPADEHASADWTNPKSHVFEAGPEPVIAWHPSSLLADLSALIDDRDFSDITFHFDDAGDSFGENDSEEDEAAKMAAAAAAARGLSVDDGSDSDVEEIAPAPAAAADAAATAAHQAGGSDAASALGGDGSPQRLQLGTAPGMTLHAHRLLLSLQNHPIRAMLHSGMREATSSRIRLHGSVGRAAFTAVLAFLYTDSLLFPVFHDDDSAAADGSATTKTVHMVDAVVASPSPESVMDILYLANQYTMRRLEVLCEGLLLRLADAQHNAAALYEFADLLNLPNLKTAVRSVAFRDAGIWRDIFCKSEGFACLAPSLVDELNQYRISQNHMYHFFQEAEHKDTPEGEEE